MVALACCPACLRGDHDHHDPAAWGRAPEGVIGGYACACPGDCPPPEGYSTDWFFKDREKRLK